MEQTRVTEDSYLKRLRANPDVKIGVCGWCPPFKAETYVYQAIGFMPGDGCRQAGWACEKCVGRYKLRYLNERSKGSMVEAIHPRSINA